MSQYYIPEELENGVKIHIPFTPYFLYRRPDGKWMIVEKEFHHINFGDEDKREYLYRFL